jgi:hypothetical protein
MVDSPADQDKVRSDSFDHKEKLSDASKPVFRKGRSLASALAQKCRSKIGRWREGHHRLQPGGLENIASKMIKWAN